MISLKDKNVLLVNAFDDEIEQEGNGKYQLSFKYPTSDQRWKNIELADLLLADDLHGEQEFRVFEIVKRNGYIFVYANQVVDDLNSYSISNISVDRVNGQTVMQALAGSIIRKHPFAFYSDIQDRHVFNQKNISVMGALANGKHSIIGQWGGDLVRDKYNVNLLKRGGRESEALFMYKKNLKSYAETNSIKGLFTRLNLSVKNSDIKTTVDSPLIGSYGGRVYELNVEVADQDVATLEQLQEYGRNYFAEKLIDVPNNSLTISVTDSQEYDVRIFDTVFVHHEIFDKDLRMKITSYRFSPMGRKLKSIGFGKIKTSLTQQVSNIATEVVEQSVSVAGQGFEEKLQKGIENADKVIDGKINKVRDEINDGIEQSRAEAERYADTIKQQIDGQLAESDRQYQLAQQAQDQKIAESLRVAGASTNLANTAKTLAEQAKVDLNLAKQSLSGQIAQVSTQTNQLFDASREETARQVAALRSAVTQDYVAKSVFEETARGISQRFESLYVGGTNLLTGTDEYTEIFNSEQSHAEFLRTPYDLAPVFDKYGLIEYTLSFDLRASQAGQVVVYQQNGSGSKYSGLWKSLTVTTEWQRFHVTFTPTEGTMSLANSYLAFYGTYGTGVKPIIRRTKIERGAIATDWSLALEDQLSYADTKIAEYKTTVDGRFANLQASVDSKANQADFQTVKETAQLYERIIGSTETSIKDKVARMVMADSLFLTEVKDKISGTATQVSQLNNSYAIKNLTSAGTVLNQINLLANGTNRIDGRLTHITGQTLIDNGVIKNAMIGSLDAGKLTAGYISSNRFQADSITGDKLVMDSAFFNKFAADEAKLKQLFAKNAFITQVQAVNLSAKQIAGGIAKALNGGMDVNFDESKINFYTNVAAIRRIYTGHPTQFIKFETEGNYSRTIIGSNRNGGEVFNSATFAGIVVENTNNINTEDNVRVYGDNTLFRHAQGDVGWNINSVTQRIVPANINAESEIWSKHFVAPDKNSKPVRLDTAVAALWDIWNHIIYNNFEFNEALRTHIKARRDNWKFELNL
ncbi:TPA: phage tail protein [Streptococcus suis]|nr:phage tail protein [Streptococcus suis]